MPYLEHDIFQILKLSVGRYAFRMLQRNLKIEKKSPSTRCLHREKCENLIKAYQSFIQLP